MTTKYEAEQYRMLSDDALAKFRIFCAAGKLPKPSPRNPEGAFDSALPVRRQSPAGLLARLKRKIGPVAFDAMAKAFETMREQPTEDDEGGITVGPDTIKRLMELLVDKVDQETADEVRSLLDGGMSMDEPPEFSGRPRPGGGMDPIRPPAMDAATAARRDRTGFEARFPEAARIKIVF